MASCHVMKCYACNKTGAGGCVGSVFSVVSEYKTASNSTLVHFEISCEGEGRSCQTCFLWPQFQIIFQHTLPLVLYFPDEFYRITMN